MTDTISGRNNMHKGTDYNRGSRETIFGMDFPSFGIPKDLVITIYPDSIEYDANLKLYKRKERKEDKYRSLVCC